MFAVPQLICLFQLALSSWIGRLFFFYNLIRITFSSTKKIIIPLTTPLIRWSWLLSLVKRPPMCQRWQKIKELKTKPNINCEGERHVPCARLHCGPRCVCQGLAIEEVTCAQYFFSEQKITLFLVWRWRLKVWFMQKWRPMAGWKGHGLILPNRSCYHH